jgi:hypothetical protein
MFPGVWMALAVCPSVVAVDRKAEWLPRHPIKADPVSAGRDLGDTFTMSNAHHTGSPDTNDILGVLGALISAADY